MPSSATTEVYTLSLHDALPICHAGAVHQQRHVVGRALHAARGVVLRDRAADHDARVHGEAREACVQDLAAHVVEIDVDAVRAVLRSEEHTSELQSLAYLVCRLLRPPRFTLFPYTTLFRSVMLARFTSSDM